MGQGCHRQCRKEEQDKVNLIFHEYLDRLDPTDAPSDVDWHRYIFNGFPGSAFAAFRTIAAKPPTPELGTSTKIEKDLD